MNIFYREREREKRGKKGKTFPFENINGKLNISKKMLQPIGEGIYDVGPTCEIFFHPVTSPPSLSLSLQNKKKKYDDDLFISFFFLVRKCLSSLHTAAAQSTVKVKCARPSTYLPVVVLKARLYALFKQTKP